MYKSYIPLFIGDFFSFVTLSTSNILKIFLAKFVSSNVLCIHINGQRIDFACIPSNIATLCQWHMMKCLRYAKISVGGGARGTAAPQAGQNSVSLGQIF